jgi:hypothetical protein
MAWVDRKERDPAAGATAHVHPMPYRTHWDKTSDANMMPDLQAILDMLVSRAIQVRGVSARTPDQTPRCQCSVCCAHTQHQ